MTNKTLSNKSVAVLTLIAEGHTYEQIIRGHEGLTYIDIFDAARQALELYGAGGEYQRRMAEIKKDHPRAYEPWSDSEDAELKAMNERGLSNTDIARHLRRQPSAIGARLAKHNFAVPHECDAQELREAAGDLNPPSRADIGD